MATNWIYDLGQWLISLDPSFGFLLALPFLVSLAGLASLFFERHRKSHS